MKRCFDKPCLSEVPTHQRYTARLVVEGTDRPLPQIICDHAGNSLPLRVESLTCDASGCALVVVNDRLRVIDPSLSYERDLYELEPRNVNNRSAHSAAWGFVV